MKTFKDYLLEADYSRFLKKNNNLTDEQRKEINKYFSRKNNQGGSDINWQSREVQNMDYNDFLNIMISYKSGFKKKLKVNVPGKKGEDYWQVRLKTKGFLAYIPLNQETAQFLNSSKYGTCKTGHCIGWKDDPSYWNDHIIDSQEVPVYIVNGRGKWVVMIEKGNYSYQVWDKMNKKDISIGNLEPIPGFSIKKELMNSKMKKLYDEIRRDFYTDDKRIEGKHVDIDDAYEAYIEIINDIDDAQTEMRKDQEWFDNETYNIKADTYNWYDNEIEDKKEEIQDSLDEISDLEDIISELEDVQIKFREDPELDTISINGEEYTEDDVEYSISSNNKDISHIRSLIEEMEGDIGGLTYIRDRIEDIEIYEMGEDDEVEWIRSPPDEDDIGRGVVVPSTFDVGYSDYFDLMEDHGYGGSRNKTDDEIRQHIYDARYGMGKDAGEILSDNDWYDPSIINED